MIIITIMFDKGSSNGYSNSNSNSNSNNNGYSNSNSNSNSNTTAGSIITSSTIELFTTQRISRQQFTAASRLQSATAARTSH